MLSANPLLGSALSQQKRKRGRPRKLSGSDMGDDYENYEDEGLQGSPSDLLEMKMSTDAFSNSGDENVISRSENDHEDSMDTSDMNKSQNVPGSNKRSHENSMSGEYQNKTKMIFFSI
jgi:Cys2His2 zinc finger developmental/cell cycle regulator